MGSPAAAVQRRQERAFRRLVRAGLWACVMCSRCPCHLCCPDGAPPPLPWVGAYDPGSEIGECPQCGSGVGIFRIAVHGERARADLRPSRRRRKTARGPCLFPFTGVREAVAAGRIDRDDPALETP